MSCYGMPPVKDYSIRTALKVIGFRVRALGFRSRVRVGDWVSDRV